MSGTALTEFDGQPIDPHSAELARALVRWHEADDDEGYAPDLSSDRAIDVVREREGREILSEATDPARALAVREDVEDEPARLPEPAEPTERAAPEPAAQKAAQLPAIPDTAALLAAIPEAQRPQVQALAERAQQWGEVEAIAAPFADALKQHGETVLDGIRTLAHLNSFATQDPGGYMAWFTARVVPPENRAKALIQLGAALGVKLVENEFNLDDEPDPEPIDVEAARQRHAGDAMVAAFERATGPDGTPAHPLFVSTHPLSGAVQRAMANAIATDVAAGGARPMTIAQMRSYYDKAVETITAALPGNRAAQEKVDKAKRASAPVHSPAAAPRRSTAPTSQPKDDDGSAALFEGIKALYGNGADA